VSVFLIGGGRDEARLAPVVAPFVAETRGRSDQYTIALLLVLEPGDVTSVERFRSLLVAAGARAEAIRVAAIAEGERFSDAAVVDVDAVFVGGGLTPAYHDAFADMGVLIGQRVHDGMPYAGFSAGAAIAAERAVVGGYAVSGADVAPADAGEELDEVEVRAGLGLVPGAIDVHAAQWGTLSRLVAVVTAGLAPAGLAIDEDTAVRFTDGAARPAVSGHGRAWIVEQGASVATVSVRRADTV
jgi:cyanophycinase